LPSFSVMRTCLRIALTTCAHGSLLSSEGRLDLEIIHMIRYSIINARKLVEVYRLRTSVEAFPALCSTAHPKKVKTELFSFSGRLETLLMIDTICS
jgi:hypothetical protein